MTIIEVFLFTVIINEAYSFLGLISGINYLMRNKYSDIFNEYSRHTAQHSKIVLEEYDFIIVGSGSAGSVIANRLSEISQWKILLLEAGKPANELSLIPIMAPILQLSPYNWAYNMEKDESVCKAMEDGICTWPRGKGLGGTSIINYMIYTRGNPIDYERWEAQGNPGWGYEGVLPYYLKSENCHLGKKCRSKYHKKNGYLSLETPFTSTAANSFIEAGKELGYRSLDYNTPDFMGFSKIQATLKHGRRHSASSAFLSPVANITNLNILTAARVTKILIDPLTKAAYGVEYIRDNRKYTAHAKKEVILSAGAFHSPQLLMLSGVGPEEHLKDLGIPVMKHLPVGIALFDHISFLGLVYTVNETIVSPYDVLNTTILLQWQRTGRGLISSLGGMEALAYINTDPTKKQNYPDIELIFEGIGSMSFDYGLFVRKSLRIKQDFYDRYVRPLENVPSFSILPMLLHPKSKGYLKLRSTDPFEAPMLYGKYFSDKENEDIKTMIRSIRFIHNLSQTIAFQKMGAQRYEAPIPGCESFEFDSDTYWECALRSLTVTLHHQIGTCKMGPEEDAEAVVDPRLKVHGIKNLRVADTSIIPVTLSAHTNGPGMMIGEKTADIIKEDWSDVL